MGWSVSACTRGYSQVLQAKYSIHASPQAPLWPRPCICIFIFLPSGMHTKMFLCGYYCVFMVVVVVGPRFGSGVKIRWNMADLWFSSCALACLHRGVHTSPLLSPGAPDSIRRQGGRTGYCQLCSGKTASFIGLPGCRKISAVSWKNAQRLQTFVIISWSFFPQCFMCVLLWSVQIIW